jgi:hypothetical protein
VAGIPGSELEREDNMSVCAKQDYEPINEETQNGYNQAIVKAVLIDTINNTYDIYILALMAKLLFGYDCQIVRWIDDGGCGLAYPKDNDRMQEQLAKMMMGKLRG